MALAVLRLITSSYLVGACTGRWQIGWLLALEDCGASVLIEPVRPVRDQAVSGDKSTIQVHRRKLILGRQFNYLLAVNEGRAAFYHDESAIRLVRKCVFVQPNSCSAWIVGIDPVDTGIVRRGAGTP
jgi:hypothetical protein